MRKLIGLLVLVCVGWAGSVNAATLVVSDGQLMGATDVNVGGTLWDVEFLDGSCNSLYDGCSSFSFTTEDDAFVAAESLHSEVFMPWQDVSSTNGLGSPNGPFHIWTYWAFDITDYRCNPVGCIKAAVNVLWESPDFGGTTQGYGLAGDSSADSDQSVHAVWSPAAASAVPLPAAAWLFISAIAGLAGAKRLSRSKGSVQSH